MSTHKFSLAAVKSVEPESFTLVPIEMEGAEAAQPWAVARSSDHKQLLGRLYEALTDAESMRRFRDLGFLWQLEDGR